MLKFNGQYTDNHYNEIEETMKHSIYVKLL